MPDYTLTFAKSARKELEKLPPQVTDRIITKIDDSGRGVDIVAVGNRKEIYRA